MVEAAEKNPTPQDSSVEKTPKIPLLDVKEAAVFLAELWGGQGNCFSIVLMRKSILFNHFCLEQWGGLAKTIAAAISWARDMAEPGAHVFFQVLPLAKKPEKGRGSAKDVEAGAWLWADLDYKEVVDKAEFDGCREGEDHALECYYREGDKWVYVKRPPLSRVLREVEEKIGAKPRIVVDSGAGYHLYFKLDGVYSASRLAKLEAILVERLGADPQSKDLARILRLPGSINPRVNREVKVIFKSEAQLDPSLLEKPILEKPRVVEISLGEKAEAVGEEIGEAEKPQQLKELGDAELLKIVEKLREAYRPGYRQLLLLYLSGWLAKARISPISAVKIAKALYEKTSDSDPLKSRLGAIVYSYKKAGIDLGPYAQAIEDLAGVKPYGLEAEIREEEVKGKSGLQEILESIVGEERALGIINELTETIGALSPYRDSIIELIDYERQIYAIANLKSLVMVRARRGDNGFTYKEKVVVAAPTHVIVYDNPIGGVRKYEIVFEGPTLKRPLKIGPALIEEIADRLRAEGLVYHSRLLNDVLNAIVNAYIKKGRAEVKAEVESPGFYLIEGNITPVKVEVKGVNKEKLREALLLLNELAETWFKHVEDRFALVIKWGAISPFTYMLKIKGYRQKYLYLYGDSATGKTTLGKIVLKMWGLDPRYEKTGASIDTPARLGYVLSQSTFPILINEPGGALIKEEIVEMIKNASDSLTARGKYVKGNYIEYPALAPLIFTSNRVLPRDDALLNRFIVITFSYGEKIPQERQALFKEAVEPKLGLLSEIGQCIAAEVLSNGLAPAETLLSKCYEIAGLEPPSWLSLEYSQEGESIELIIKEEFIERLKKYVNDNYSRYISKVVVESGEVLFAEDMSIQDRLDALLRKNLLPGMRLKGEEVIITRTLLKELGLEDKTNLKSLAEMLGPRFVYQNKKVDRKGLYVIMTTMQDLINLFV